MNTSDEKNISDFWRWFLNSQSNLEGSLPADQVWDQLLAELHRIEPGLFYEASQNQIPKELVITAQGNKSLFQLVERIVQFAPLSANWRFVALKPPMGFNFQSKYEGLTLEPEKMWFLPLSNQSAPSALGVRVGVPGYTIERDRDFQNAILMILDTALGERSAASEIHHIETGPLPTDPATEGYIELPELSKYIAWHSASYKDASS